MVPMRGIGVVEALHEPLFTNPNDEIRMTKPATAQLRIFRHSGFGFLSSFVIRHSTTCASQVHGPNACGKNGRRLSMNCRRPRQVLAPVFWRFGNGGGTKAPEDWRSPGRYRAIRRLMDPMNAKNRKGAFHEPRRAVGIH